MKRWLIKKLGGTTPMEVPDSQELLTIYLIVSKSLLDDTDDEAKVKIVDLIGNDAARLARAATRKRVGLTLDKYKKLIGSEL